MSSENETVEAVKKRMLKWADEDIHEVGRDVLRRQAQQFARDFESAWRREKAELCNALKKAYDTLYLISRSRYGEGLTCTDSIHEVVTMAKKCEEELYANEAIRKIVEPSEEGGEK